MFSPFLNPFAMVVGGAAVSAPILIHLINRLRFRRIRWAAMEFLLMAQRKTRKPLIVKQIILLMMRCLLVLLFGFLVARFLGQTRAEEDDQIGDESKAGVVHVFLVDDGLSMSDGVLPKQGGGERRKVDCIQLAAEQIQSLAAKIHKEPGPQHLVLMSASQRQPLFKLRLNEKVDGDNRGNLQQLNTQLERSASADARKKDKKALRATEFTADMAAALQACRAELAERKNDQKRLYVVSDFREAKWKKQPGQDDLHDSLDTIAKEGVPVYLVDAANFEDQKRPAADDQRPEYNNNYCITDFRSERRVALANTNVSFVIELEHFGVNNPNVTPPESLLVHVFVDGVENFEATRQFAAPQPGMKVRTTFDMSFPPSLGREASKFHRITAKLDAFEQNTALAEDNIRHAVVEVRKSIPILVVDGNQAASDDTRFLSLAFESLRTDEKVDLVLQVGVGENVVLHRMDENGRKVSAGAQNQLLRTDLDREYATIYLLNVPDLKLKDKKREDLPLNNLSAYVKGGGNLVYFMGPDVDRDYYTKTLYEKERGLFPVPIEEVATPKLTEEEQEKLRRTRSPKVYVLDPDHPITRFLFANQYNLYDLLILQHTKTLDRFQWYKNEWSKEGDIKELITLAKNKKLDDGARGSAQDLINKLPRNNSTVEWARFAKYHARLQVFHAKMLETLNKAKEHEIHLVVKDIDEMLNDRDDAQGVDKKDRAPLIRFWAESDPIVRELKRNFENYKKDALYGSPLLVARKVGKGNSVAFLTTAGSKWNGWAGDSEKGGVAAISYAPTLADLQRHLSSGGDVGSRILGEPVIFSLDAAKYQSRILSYVQADDNRPAPTVNPDEWKDAPPPPPGFLPANILDAKPNADKSKFDLTTTVPFSGVHLFRIPKENAPADNKYEERWFAYNVDTERESNLQRIASEHLVYHPDASENKSPIRFYDSDEREVQTKERERPEDNDPSRSFWIYGVFLLLLAAEQALAVHLSFHAKAIVNPDMLGIPDTVLPLAEGDAA